MERSARPRTQRGTLFKMETLDKVSLFWDVDRTTLDLHKHARFIVRRILEFGDLDDLQWALEQYGREYIASVAASARGLDPKSANFWRNYFARQEAYAS